MEMVEHYYAKTRKCSECGAQVKTEEKRSKYKKAKNQSADLNDIELNFSNRKKEKDKNSEKTNSQGKLFIAKPTVKKASSPTVTKTDEATKEKATKEGSKKEQTEKQKVDAQAKKRAVQNQEESPKGKVYSEQKETQESEAANVNVQYEDVNISDDVAEIIEDGQQEDYVDEMLEIGLGKLNYDEDIYTDESDLEELHEKAETDIIVDYLSSSDADSVDAAEKEMAYISDVAIKGPEMDYGVPKAKKAVKQEINNLDENEEDNTEAHHEPSLKDVILSKYRKTVLHEEGDALKCSDWLKEKRKQNLEKKQEQKETTYEFNFNHDGFYDDTVSIGEAKPDTIGKQILVKAIGSIVALFLIIAFLIYYA